MAKERIKGIQALEKMTIKYQIDNEQKRKNYQQKIQCMVENVLDMFAFIASKLYLKQKQLSINIFFTMSIEVLGLRHQHGK